MPFINLVSTEDMVKCKKVVVNISNLLILAQQKCHRPDCSEMITSCTPTVTGCSIKLLMICKARHFMEWYSCLQLTSVAGGTIPANNLLEAASILLSGNHYAKIFMKNRIFNVHGISESTFYRYMYYSYSILFMSHTCRYQKHFFIPVVQECWLANQEWAVSCVREKGEALVIAGTITYT